MNINTMEKTFVQTAVIPNTKCQLCDKKKIQWKCFTCEEFLCGDCKQTHLRSRASCDHKVTTIYGADARGPTDINCRLHPEQEVIFFCQACEKFICQICITRGNHNAHKMKMKNEIIEEKAKEISMIMNDLHENLSSLDIKTAAVKKIRADYSSDSAKCIALVKTRYENTRTKSDELLEDSMQKIAHNEGMVETKLIEKETQIDNSKEAVRKLIRKCEEKHERGGMDLVQDVKDIKNEHAQLPTNIYLPSRINPPTFVTRDGDMNHLAGFFGELHLKDEKEMDRIINCNPFADTRTSSTTITTYERTSVTHETVNVLSSFHMENMDRVAAVSDEQAWFGKSGHDNVTLVALNGQVLQTVHTLDISDLAVNKSGELFFIHFDGRCLGKLTTSEDNQDYRPEDIYRNVNVNGCMARITVTDDNDFIVGLHDYETDTNKIIKLSPEGQLIFVIENERKPWIWKLLSPAVPLFNGDLKSVCQNINGDIVVAHTGEVTVVDKDRHTKFSYRGNPQDSSRPFDPCDAVTDKHGHIYISDGNNAVIHILDMNGHFVKSIVLKHISGISVDNKGNLWVCCNAEKMVLVLNPFPQADDNLIPPRS